MVKFRNIINVTQKGKFAEVKADFNAWKNKWGKGTAWGIVGGSPRKNLPDTVLDQALEHGEPDFARDRARTIEGIGALLESITEILDGDVITVDHRKTLENDIKQMLKVLRSKKWNPRNIPFHTVVEFTETDDPEKPKVKRAKVYGHYRTKAYNDYAEWANEYKNANIKIAETKDEWWSTKVGEAKPPLWLAISQETNEGILSIAKKALDAVGGIKLGPDAILPVYNNTIGPVRLAQIQSVQQYVRQIVNDPSIYPRGKSRAPVKGRLWEKFDGEKGQGPAFAIANEEEAKLFDFVKNWNQIEGRETLKQVKLAFPKNNIALNKLIREVLGDEINTIETPKSRAGEAKEGLVLKWEEVLKQ